MNPHRIPCGIEKVSGITYEDYIEQKIFAKLGMQRSSYCSNSEVVPRRAYGYQLTPQGLVQAPYIDHTWPYSAGSLCSNAGDLITWLRALHGGKVLPPASYQDLITPGKLEDDRAPDVAARSRHQDRLAGKVQFLVHAITRS